MKHDLSVILAIILLSFLAILFAITTPDAKAAATNIVISEIQTNGVTAGDEFVELYNPTNSDIVMTNWRLVRQSSTGTPSNLVTNLSGTIKARGYYLITPQTGYTGPTSADKLYSGTSSAITSNSTVLLYSDASITLVDAVGFGTATNKEGSASSNPGVGGSLERKASTTSTPESMTTGDDALMGNGEDTNNNLADFVVRVVSQPQNSVSIIEPAPTATPSNTPTATPSPTNTPSPTMTPTPTSTPTPTPTAAPTPTVTMTPTPTPSPTPTVAPTTTPTPTVPTVTPTSTVTPPITPSITSTPTPTPSFPKIPQFNVVCTTNTITVNIAFLQFKVPMMSCHLVTL